MRILKFKIFFVVSFEVYRYHLAFRVYLQSEYKNRGKFEIGYN